LTDPLFIAYLTFTFLLAVTPGSTTAVVVRNTLSAGRRAGLATAAGAALGNTSQATAAGLGLAVLLAQFPAAAYFVRLGGAAYLAWLGATSIWRVSRRSNAGFRALSIDATAVQHERSNTAQTGTSVRQGLTVNLLNPAVTTFYLVVVPSFLPAGAPRWYYAFLASIHIAIAFCCHGAWALAFHRLRELFRMPQARRVLEAATGVVLLALAAQVILQT